VEGTLLAEHDPDHDRQLLLRGGLPHPSAE